MTKTLLELVKVKKAFSQTGGKPLEIFNNINLVLTQAEMIGLFSPSGAGKTSLLQIAGLLDSPSSGKIIISGHDTATLSDYEKTFLRSRSIGFVYQFHHLLPELSAIENVSMAQWPLGVSKLEAEQKAFDLLKSVGLADRLNHRPTELSGGEQQRVALCRALINDPKILLADEPTGNLDPEASELVFDILIKLVKERGLAALIVTHNANLVKKMDKAFVLENKILRQLKL
tara:strand:- start:262 stop:951 length:690 start_codon:yes stop_codon:yes gene_type:complete